MTDELVKQWDEYVESMGSVMGGVEHMAQQMRDRIEALTAERDRLREAIETISYYNTVGYTDMALDVIKYVTRAALKGESHD